ncbi:phosphopantetheine-binding protein [Streptomyces sulphureus]|uniref:phosphopantetheine-binding protein n=1 Tax=Streptomyces sulphureus TaxID=47758 RepID=UPI0003647C04|nr:phosphopantetheine-binding protein [Streptomyces sulphureus]
MDRQGTIQAIEAGLTDVLEREVSGLAEETRFFEDLHLDSTSILELLMSLEEELGFQVDPDELDMKDFVSVGTFVDYLDKVVTA